MNPKHLYNLTPEEFERLVAALLAESGYSDVRRFGRQGPANIDITAKRNDDTV